MALLEISIAEPPPLFTDENGVVRVGGTRVTLDTVIGAYEDGASVEEIVQAYDTLALADVHAVLSYYLKHREEAQAYLAERRQQAAEVRRKNEARFSSQEIRERLQARREQNHQIRL